MKKGIITGMALLFTLAAGTTAFAAGAAGMGGNKTIASAYMHACMHGENICAGFGRNCGAAETVNRYNQMREYCPPAADAATTAGCDGSGAYCTQPLDENGNRICSYHGNEYCNPSNDCSAAPCESNSAYCTQPLDENGNRICGVHNSNCVNGQDSESSGTVSGGHHSRHHGGGHH